MFFFPFFILSKIPDQILWLVLSCEKENESDKAIEKKRTAKSLRLLLLWKSCENETRKYMCHFENNLHTVVSVATML